MQQGAANVAAAATHPAANPHADSSHLGRDEAIAAVSPFPVPAYLDDENWGHATIRLLLKSTTRFQVKLQKCKSSKVLWASWREGKRQSRWFITLQPGQGLWVHLHPAVLIPSPAPTPQVGSQVEECPKPLDSYTWGCATKPDRSPGGGGNSPSNILLLW